jgi:hypothetical protein
VLAQDAALFARLESREGAVAAERVPNGPGPGFVQDRLARAIEQPKTQVGLEAGAVRAAEHGEIRAQLETRSERGEHRAHLGHEVERFLAEREQAEAERIVHVLVNHGADLGRAQRFSELADRPVRPGFPRAAEHQKLHEEPAVEELRLALDHGPALADIEGRLLSAALAARMGARFSGVGFAHGGSLPPC